MAEHHLCPLHEAASAAPDRPALLTPQGDLTWGECDRRVRSGAAQLCEAGVRPGDRVGLTGPPSADMVLAFWSILCTGAVACLLSHRWPPTWISTQCQRLRLSHLVSLHAAGAPPCPHGTRLLERLSWDQSPREPATHECRCRRDSGGTIVFTSGSSGTPRAAVHTLETHRAATHGLNEHLRFDPSSRWLLSLPLHHVAGLAVLFRAAAARATVVIPAPGASWDHLVSDQGVTHLSMVPTQLYRLLEIPATAEAVARRVTAILVGGAALGESLARRALETGLPIVNSYGLTEMASTVTATDPTDPAGAAAGCGHPLPGREVTIADDGEILVRGRSLFQGYLTDSRPERPLKDGWFATGDLGHWDRRSGLVVTGRKDNRFISGGENIQPETIERAILTLPRVQQAVVVPVPNREYGHRPLAFIQTSDQSLLDTAQLRARLENLLPRFMLPDAVLPWPDETGLDLKEDRRALAALAERRLGS